MKIPRDLSGHEISSYLLHNGFERVKQTGSHVQFRHFISSEKVTIPLHDPLKIGLFIK